MTAHHTALTTTRHACQVCGRISDRRRCDEHQRGNPRERGYSKEFEANRRQLLATNPACIHCGQPATVAHHEPPRRTLVAMNVTNPDDQVWLKAVCATCHNQINASPTRQPKSVAA